MASKLARGRRLKAALVSGGLLAGVVLVTAAGPAHSVASPAPAGFNAYANGTALHVHALESDPTKIADVDHAFSSVRVSGAGLGDQVQNEMKELVNPPLPSKNAYARGGGAEVGLGSPVPTDPSGKALLLPNIAEASAPTAAPPYTDGLKKADPNTQQVLDLEGALDPLANATALHGRAAALWNPNYLFPTLGNPLTYGYGEAADAQVLNTGTGLDSLGRFVSALIKTDTSGPDRGVVSAQSFSYLVNNGDGSCGIAQEIHETLAPIAIADTNVLEIGGDWTMKAVATGQSTGNSFSYGYDPSDPNSANSVARLIDTSTTPPTVTPILAIGDLLGPAGLDVPLTPLLDLTVGEAPRAVAAPGADPVYQSKPTLPTQNGGTALSVAADAVRLNVLSGAAPGLQGADIRLGHFEMKASVPAGGVNCEIPVSKTSNIPVVNTGTTATFTVKVPNDPKLVAPFPCDMTNVSVTDKVERVDGTAKMNLDKITGPKGEVVNGSGDRQSITINTNDTWSNGQPSLIFTINASVPADSGAGTMKDTATASASVGNCKASNSVLGDVIGVNGANLVGPGIRGNGVIRGSGILNGPPIAKAHVLAVTGRNDTIYLGFALAALASAFGVVRLRRRLTNN
jgi:hypothetical protein